MDSFSVSSWCFYLSRTAKSFCCSRAWTNVTRKCLLLRRVENRVMPSSTLGLVVLFSWGHKGDETVISLRGVTYTALHTCCALPNLFSPALVSSDQSKHFIFLSHFLLLPLRAPPPVLSVSSAPVPHCVWLPLNVPTRLNEYGLSVGATKQQCDEVFPLDCSHMVWFAVWQKENRGVH